MKRFLVFAGDCYYPSGGWDDFHSDHDTADEAQKAAINAGDWWHVVDSQERRIVPDFSGSQEA